MTAGRAGRAAIATALAFIVLAPQPAAAAPLDPATVVVTGVQASAGAVEFFLAGRELPAGTTLAQLPLSVTADGVRLPSTSRTITVAERDESTRAVVLVIDASGSMAGARLSAARAAAADYAAAVPDGVSLGLVTVADRPRVVLAPTTDRAAFTTAAARIDADGSTALYDGIRAGVDLLDPKLRPESADFVERRVVVLSDGADTASALTAEELRRRLTGTELTVDAVAFGAEADRVELGTLTEVTGGRVLPAADTGALRSVFRAMAAGLSPPVVVRAVVPAGLAGRSSTLRVEVRVDRATAVAQVPVTFVADSGAGAKPVPFLVARPGGQSLIVTVAVLAVVVFLGALLLVRPLLVRNPMRRRLRQLHRFTATGRPAAAGQAGAADSPVLRAALAMSERAVRSAGHRERMELALDRAGSSLRVAEWQLIRAGVSLAVALALILVLPWWVGLPGGLLAGWLGSAQYLRMRIGRRTGKFADQLPEALQLVVGSLRSGFSLPQSIDSLVREGADPVAGELGRALAETRLGGDLEDALERVGQRNASQDIEWLVMAIRIQREVGGNLSEVLETAVTTMRERGRLARHVRGLSAEGRLSALILFGMPIVLGLFMLAFRRDYLRPLYTEPMGLAMLGGSAVMMAVGGLWLRKLVKVVV